MPGIKQADGAKVDIGVRLDEQDQVIISPNQRPITIRAVEYENYDNESLTVDNTAGGVQIDITKITADTRRIFVTLETAQIRFQLEPNLTITAGGTEGSDLMEVGGNLTILGNANVRNIRFIRTGGTSGIAQVSLWREVPA